MIDLMPKTLTSANQVSTALRGTDFPRSPV